MSHAQYPAKVGILGAVAYSLVILVMLTALAIIAMVSIADASDVGRRASLTHPKAYSSADTLLPLP